MSEFKEFPKITRFYEQDVVVTEKLDGTNGLIHVSDDLVTVRAGSRNRWIHPGDDNYGFARWVQDNEDALRNLGPGYHYGEWWGNGIQRRYAMTKKVFSLFNVHRWSDSAVRPACCDVVPTLYTGPLTPDVLNRFSKPLTHSAAALTYGIDFKEAEGVMIYFTKGGIYFKAPVDKGAKG